MQPARIALSLMTAATTLVGSLNLLPIGTAYAAGASTIPTQPIVSVSSCTAPCVTPSQAAPGATVTVFGTFPATRPAGAMVSFAGFRGSPQPVIGWSASSVTAAVPGNLVAGRYELTVSWTDPATGAKVSTADRPIWLQVLGPNPSLVLQPNVRILDAVTLQSIAPVTLTQLNQPQLNLTLPASKITTGLITIAAPPPAQVGDVLLAGVSPTTPSGLFRKVTAVQSLGSSYTVVTVPATLRDAIVQGNIAASGPINNASIRQALTNQGILSSTSSSSGCPNTFDLPLTNGADIKGSLCADLDVEGQVYVDPTDAGASVTIAGGDTLDLKAVATGNIAQNVPLYTLQLGNVAMGPFVLSLELDLSVAANGQVVGTLSVGSTQSAAVALGASCDVSVTSGLSCGTQTNATNSFTSDTPTFGDKVDLTMSGTAQLLARLDGEPLVDLSLQPMVHGVSDKWSDPWYTITGELKLTLNYDLAKLIGISDGQSAVLADLQAVLDRAHGAAPGVTPTLALSLSPLQSITTGVDNCTAQIVQVGNTPKLVEGCGPIMLFVTAKDAASGHPIEFSQVTPVGCTTDATGKCSADMVPDFPGVGVTYPDTFVVTLPDAVSNPVTVTVQGPAKIS